MTAVHQHDRTDHQTSPWYCGDTRGVSLPTALPHVHTPAHSEHVQLCWSHFVAGVQFAKTGGDPCMAVLAY